jgi:nucleotide-binding universal stress UspA family protein
VYPASLLEKLARDAHNRAVAAVEQARTILCSAKLPVDAACTPLGDARAVVLDNAKGWGADLIILGSHGLAGLDRLVLGSVSETVALHAHSSVRVVRSRKVRQES